MGAEPPGLPPDCAYARFIESELNRSRHRRGKGDVARVLEYAPLTGLELANYFAALPLPVLAGSWVGCVMSMALSGQFDPAELARPLMVVANRLHNQTMKDAAAKMNLGEVRKALVEIEQRQGLRIGPPVQLGRWKKKRDAKLGCLIGGLISHLGAGGSSGRPNHP